MADYETIMKALRNADAAGDEAAAKRLAQMAREARQVQPAAQASAPQPASDAAPYGSLSMESLQGVVDQRNDQDAAMGTWLNRAGESMTLGLVGDEASARVYAALPGRTYEGELDRFRQNEANMSTAGRLTADLAGALIPGLGAAGLIGQASSLPARAGLGALTGGASGATYGFMEGEGGVGERVQDAKSQGVLGALVGGAIPVVGAGVRSVAKGRAGRQAIQRAAQGAPTSEALRAEGNALYRQIDDAGVQIKPKSFDNARAEIIDYLRANTGYDELPGPGSLTPNTARVMQIMDEAGGQMAQEPTAALPFRSLDQMRRQAGAAAGNVANKSDQKAGVAVIQQLDDFVQRLGPDDIVAGDVDALKTAIPKAREVWSRMSRSQIVDDAMEKADNYLSGSASGIRNQFKNILNNKKLAAQFTDAEKAALRSVTHGSALEQLINLAGGGLAQMATIGGGFAAGGPLGALGGAGIAAGQRKLAETMTARSAERARAAIASGALRNPEIAELLAISGQGAERLTNSGLIAALLASQQAQ